MLDTGSQSSALRAALDIADANQGRSIDALVRLVRTPSLTGEEAAAQKQIATSLDALGGDTKMLDIDLPALFDRFPDVAQYPTHWQHDLILGYETRPTHEALRKSGLEAVLNYQNRPNVVAVWPGEGNGRSLILNGHMDTVTVEPAASWTRDPFGAEIEDGRMYGRGTSDMKGGLMAAQMAIAYLREAGVRLRGDLILQSVVNEEHSGNGTLDLVRRGYQADAAIVLEPTNNRVFVSHPGGLYWQVTVPGVQRSPGSRWERGVQTGISAIEKLPAVISSLIEMERTFNRQHGADAVAAKHPPMSLVIGKVSGGHYETVTAGEATLRGAVYFPPQMGSVDDMIHAFRGCIGGANAKDSFLSEKNSKIEFLHHDDPTLQEDGNEVADHMESLVPPPPCSHGTEESSFACDMRHLVNQAKIPSIVFGPGAIAQAHKPDEHIEVAEYLASIRHLISFIGTWCNLEKDDNGPQG